MLQVSHPTMHLPYYEKMPGQKLGKN
jgi:hypothetical protein